MALTGGVRLRKMLLDGKIDRPYLWIDTYNQIAVPDVTGTITTRVDSSTLYYVTVPCGDPIKF